MEKKYAVIERVHFMCPRMIIGIKFHINRAYSESRLKEAVYKLSEVHPFLCCTVNEDEKGLYYDDTGKNLTEVIIKNDDDYMKDYKTVSDNEWNVFNAGLLKVFAYQKNNGFDVLFTANHMLCDGRGVMQLVKDFTALYSENEIAGQRKPHLISTIADLPDGCELKGINKFVVDRVIKEWRKENKRVSYEEYISFLKEFTESHPVEYKVLTVDELKMNVIAHKCQEYNISINSVLVSAFSAATGINKAGIAADIRGKLSFYNEGTMGNYASAFGITSSCRKLYQCYEKARDIEKKISEKLRDNYRSFMALSCILKLDSTLLDSMFISSFGGFESKAGKTAGRMFGMGSQKGLGVTNLGKYEIGGIDDVVFIAPGSPVNEQTIGVVTVNGKMNICDSFYSNIRKPEEIADMLNDIYKVL